MYMNKVKTKFYTDRLIFRIGSLNHASLSQCSCPCKSCAPYLHSSVAPCKIISRSFRVTGYSKKAKNMK